MFKNFLIISMLVLLPGNVIASQMNFEFKNPQFNGDGWSQHALTIENEEFARKQAIEAQKRADQAMKDAASKNTNLAKFLNNLESRIYAQLSLQLSNAMFSGDATTGSVNFEGTTINWVKDTTAQIITLTVIDPTGNKTEITVPIGSFAF